MRKKQIFLIGLPGSGKTTLGALAAKRLSRPFYDMDELIEQRSGQSVNELFARYGEEGFRALESRMLDEIEKSEPGVVATGGGLPMQKANERALKRGYVIFVDRSPGEIAKTLKTSTRPLLANPERFFALARERRETYLRLADAVILAATRESGVREIEALVEKQEEEARGPLGGTKRLAVAGNPIGHTLSPLLHNTLYRLLGIDARYEALHVPKGCLGELLALEPRLFGFNLTMPHKEDAAKLFLTEPEGLGSVNAVKFTQSGALGTSTDARGFIRGLGERVSSLSGANIVLLGAGGAARAIAKELIKLGAARLSIFNRTPEKAKALAKSLGECAVGFGMEKERLLGECESADMLINSTSCGMEGAEEFTSLDFVDALPSGALVSDLVYRPAETELIKAASARGLDAQNGLNMLAYQGILAHEFFFGLRVPDEIAKQVIETLRKEI